MSPRRALVCAPVIPQPDRESGSRRLFDWIDFLVEDGWSVTLVAGASPDSDRWVRHLRQRGVATYVGPEAPLEELLRTAHFDLALLAFWQVAESRLLLLRQIAPRTRILVDSVDLHFLRNTRRVFQRAGPDDPIALLDQNVASEIVREINTYTAADGVLTISEKEAGMLRDLTGNTVRTFTVPDAEDPAPSPLRFSERRGILFVGNFWHAPNVGAAEFLCRQILPRLDPKLLAEHPISIVGNALNDTVRRCAEGHAQVRLVGWVPSVLPYLQQARISVVPLLYGAGTKRKLIQSLMAGTPVVSTTIGVEGLDLQDHEHVLVADGPIAFAEAIGRLLRDEELWQRLALAGMARLGAAHARPAIRDRFLQAVAAVLACTPRAAPVGWHPGDQPRGKEPGMAYPLLVQRIRKVVRTTLPAGARVIVVSKGDDQFRDMDAREGWHFPQTPAGEYAGSYPADSAEAIRHLEALRGKGGEFLLFPGTAVWWLDFYVDFRRHLEDRYERLHTDDSCVIFRLTDNTPTRSVSEGISLANASGWCCPNPVFIIGSPRSGTTALALALAEHSQLWTSAESDILYHLFENGHAEAAFEKATAGPGQHWLEKQGVSKQEFLGSLGLGLNALFTSRSRGKRWIDQTPLYTLIAEVLADLFPGAFFVHILRDGRQVVHSMMHFLQSAGVQQPRIGADRIGTWSTDFREACKTWSHYTSVAMALAAARPDRCRTVVNEQLLADPAGGFRGICSFLGLPYEEGPARYFATHRVNSSFHYDTTTSAAPQANTNPWAEWTPDQKRIFVEEAGPALVQYGLATAEELGVTEFSNDPGRGRSY